VSANSFTPAPAASSPTHTQPADSSSANPAASSPTLGLRERKKIKTRQTIRREAFRLIDENGYAATTVEQIAEAAEVSPSTFFRYFPSKESVLLADDMDPAILDALAAQPPDLSPSQAVRRAYETAMSNMSVDQREFENTRQRLMFSIPELKAAMYDEYHRTVTAFAEAMAHRIGRDAGDFELRVFAGALTGAMMAVYDPGPGAADTVYRALDFVDAGMPLT
jgi:AcrR family transcriptional regulator